MSNFKRVLLALTFVLSVGIYTASAVPAYPHPITATQSDGSVITVRIIGDENYNYTITNDGYTVMRLEDGDYYYAQLDANGQLEPTKVMVKSRSKMNAADGQALKSIKKMQLPAKTAPKFDNQTPFEQVAPMRAQSSVNGLTPPQGISDNRNAHGNLKSLVILIETPDKRFIYGKDKFQDLVMQEGYSANGATGSARDYYLEQSGGKFDPDFVVVGPYTAKNNMSYYGEYDSGMQTLAKEAILAADADVDFAEFATAGTVRDVFIFFPGHNEAEGGGTATIWPHRWAIPGGVSVDGVKASYYACTSELKGSFGSNMAGISTFCHEFGHVLGWPDFYDCDYAGSGGEADGLDNYSLMCSGSYNNQGRTPPSLSILERWMVGWAEPEELQYTGLYHLPHVGDTKGDSEERGHGYVVRTSSDKNEYFMLDSRGGTHNVWDSYIGAAKGLSIVHVDYSSSKQYLWKANTLNNNPSHECAKMVRAVIGGSAGQTFFPGSSAVKDLSSESNAHFNAWDNSPLEVSLFDIAFDTKDSSISMKVRGSEPGVVRFDSYKDEYNINEEIRLAALETPAGATTAFYADGELLTGSTARFTTKGTHTITIVVTLAGGQKQQVVKYIRII